MVTEHGSGISAVERARRRMVADRARHSTEMEGGWVPADTEANIDRYVAGEIDSAELVAVEAAGLEQRMAARAGG